MNNLLSEIYQTIIYQKEEAQMAEKLYRGLYSDR